MNCGRRFERDKEWTACEKSKIIRLASKGNCILVE